jgi:hypothetical protein
MRPWDTPEHHGVPHDTGPSRTRSVTLQPSRVWSRRPEKRGRRPHRVRRSEIGANPGPAGLCDRTGWQPRFRSSEVVWQGQESYRDVEELLAERGVEVDHVTIYRWVQQFIPLLAEAARPCRHAVGDRWQIDETYVKVAGPWRYVDRAVDQFGQVIDVLVSARGDAIAARRCFDRAIGTTKVTPTEVVTDRAATHPIVMDDLLPWPGTEPSRTPTTRPRAGCIPSKAVMGATLAIDRGTPMRVVVALGGNALLRRGEPMTADVQRGNVKTAARALASVAGKHQLVLSHGNGPQVGLLALQAA